MGLDASAGIDRLRGWSYFVEHHAYLEHVKRFANQEEVSSFVCKLRQAFSHLFSQISTCAGFAAIHLANLKKMRVLYATGVAGIACSRHEMWRPGGLGVAGIWPENRFETQASFWPAWSVHVSFSEIKWRPRHLN